MSQLVHTSQLPPRERFDYWRHLVSTAFVPLEPRAKSEETTADFRGQIQAAELGALKVCEVRADEHVARRTPRTIASADTDYYKLGLQIRGHCLLVQDGREALLGPGDFALYDTTRPYTLDMDAHRILVFMFPRERLGISAQQVSAATATRLCGRQGLGAALSPLLVQLAQHVDDVDPAHGVRLASTALDLLTSMFTERLDLRNPDPDSMRRSLVQQIMSYIERSLGDPDLTPDQIAAAHHISTRYLHKLFRAEKTTVAGWVRERRLGHCARDLRDPLLVNRTVGTIAARWGFTDAAHFSRLFKATFDSAPREYRATALAQRG